MQSQTLDLDEDESFRNGNISEEAQLLSKQVVSGRGGEMDNFLIQAQMAKKKTNIKNTVIHMMKSALMKAPSSKQSPEKGSKQNSNRSSPSKESGGER
mmetsp:Transcript_5097/g.7760  ORF Transcript_5097/g.7760 Transcript_5097/m.7760 type:complete len:98 (+) Transcript_5097:2024-2317(+)